MHFPKFIKARLLLQSHKVTDLVFLSLGILLREARRWKAEKGKLDNVECEFSAPRDLHAEGGKVEAEKCRKVLRKSLTSNFLSPRSKRGCRKCRKG